MGRWLRSWAVWSAPRRVIGYVGVVDAGAALLVLLAARDMAAGRAELVAIAVLLGVAAVILEVGRRVERRREAAAEGAGYVDVQEVWVFAGLLLLPAPLLGLLIAVTYAHSWCRLRRITPHRWVFSAATTVLACAAGTAVLAAVTGGVDWPGLGPRGSVAILTAGAAYWFVQVILVVVAIRLSTPGGSIRTALGDPGEQLVTAAAIGLGVALAVTLRHEPWLVLVILLTVLALHQGVLVHVDHLRAAARTDPKTGLVNSTYWFQLAAKELTRAARRGTTLGVLLLDLDHFKRVNDQHGHLTGDDVIKAVSVLLRREVREYDVPARFGGEEFAVLVPDLASDAELLALATRLREQIAQLRVPVRRRDRERQPDPGPAAQCTISIGAALYPTHADTLEHLVLAADTACYQAKAAGRDTVRLAAQPPTTARTKPSRDHVNE